MSNTTEKVTKTNRHYGEGSIYQHKDGRWVAKYRDEAMAKPQYLYGSTEAEVRRKLRDWKKQTARGLTACKKVFFVIMQITGFTRSSSTLSKTAVLTVTKAFICIISSLYWAIFRLRLSAARRFRICWLRKAKRFRTV